MNIRDAVEVFRDPLRPVVAHLRRGLVPEEVAFGLVMGGFDRLRPGVAGERKG